MKTAPGLALWFIGPQLIGVFILLIGWVQKKWPPKKFNNLYGYRTASAMKNQKTWDEANRYSAMVMMKFGIVLIVIGFTISAVINAIHLQEKIKVILLVMPCVAAGMGSAIVMMVKTEKHLANTFDEKKE